MKYFFLALLLILIAIYLLLSSMSIQESVNVENDSNRNNNNKYTNPLISSDSNDIQASNGYSSNSNMEIVQGYFTEEYYIYDMSIKCQSFIRNSIRTKDELEEFLNSNFPQEVNQIFNPALNAEMRHNFKRCEKLLEKNSLNMDKFLLTNLLTKAIEKKDPSALARKAFEEVIMNKKQVSSVKHMLVESLATNNPESLYSLSIFVLQFSEIKDKYLVGNALMSRACDVGYDGCDYNSFQVQLACQEKSGCGSNLQETIRMSVPIDLLNEFESTLDKINNIRTEVEWEYFFNATFHE